MNEIIQPVSAAVTSGAVAAVASFASVYLSKATAKVRKETELVENQLRLSKAQADATESSSRLMNEAARKFASSGMPSGIVLGPCGDPSCPNCKGDGNHG